MMSGMKQQGILIVMSGPSGAGKGTLCQALRAEIAVKNSISATTRAPRAGEIDGESYYFLSQADFEARINAGGFLEWARVYDNYYGTPRDFVEVMLAEGHDCMLEIDPQGAMAIKAAKPDAVLVFIMPPSYDVLKDRITGRGTETPEQIAKRLSCAVDEINTISHYDYVIVNDTIAEAVEDLRSIIRAEKCLVRRNQEMSQAFLSTTREEPVS